MTAVATLEQTRTAQLRVVVGEDDVLLREGLVRLLEDAGIEVLARTGDARDLLGRSLALRPDVVLVDVRMPPGLGADGLQAALELRRRLPSVGVLVLSHHQAPELALALLGDRPEGVGYLLKERVGDLPAFLEAVRRVAAGGVALDPRVVAGLLNRLRPDDPLHDLTSRQREVLAGMAEGRSNRGIARDLHLSEAAVEKHVTALFRTLALDESALEHRRVHAVLAHLRSTGSVV